MQAELENNADKTLHQYGKLQRVKISTACAWARKKNSVRYENYGVDRFFGAHSYKTHVWIGDLWINSQRAYKLYHLMDINMHQNKSDAVTRILITLIGSNLYVKPVIVDFFVLKKTNWLFYDFCTAQCTLKRFRFHFRFHFHFHTHNIRVIIDWMKSDETLEFSSFYFILSIVNQSLVRCCERLFHRHVKSLKMETTIIP